MLLRNLAAVALFLGACNRTPEPADRNDEGATGASSGSSSSDGPTGGERPPGTGAASTAGSTGGSGQREQGPTCSVPLVAPAPVPVESVKDCPADPGGRPTMPTGRVTFEGTTLPITLDVELALTDSHRQHGLMYRDSLAESEGMLFTFDDEEVRTFWMHNTCLALDMLFIEESGFISGILEQVPPWNDARRSINCPVKHVLEVRAGWTRDHDVRPGQRITIEAGSER